MGCSNYEMLSFLLSCVSRAKIFSNLFSQVGEKIRVILDCEDNTLSFEKNFEFLGVAFRGLPKQELYPSISAVYGNTEVSMVYLGPPLDG